MLNIAFFLPFLVFSLREVIKVSSISPYFTLDIKLRKDQNLD